MVKVTVDGVEYELVYDFGLGRGIINMEGIFVLVDRVDDTLWELSGNPARDHEKPILQKFIDMVETTVKVTTPEGTVTTFTDEGGSVKR